jgi:hypothetical protein
MKTSGQVMFLVTVLALCTGYAFYLNVRREAANHRFLEWLKTERQGSCNALTPSDRLLSIRAVEILRRGVLADDTEFIDRYRNTRHGFRFAIAMSAAGVGVALLILGTVTLDWSW